MSKSAIIRIQASSFDPAAEIGAFRVNCGDVGALASFTGYVRGEGGRVDTLELEHYAGFTEARINDIAIQAYARFDITDALIIHRYGRMTPEEPIVLVAAASAHRKDAINAVDFLMDYLKTDAPFWKKQSGDGEETWIEPRAADRNARKDWEE